MATPVSSPSSLCHPGLVTSSALLSIWRTAQELGQVTLAVRFTQSNLQIIAQLDMGPSCTLTAAPFLRVWQCSVHPGMLRISRRNTTCSTSFPTSSSEEKKGEFLTMLFHLCLSIICFSYPCCVSKQLCAMTDVAEVAPTSRQILGADHQ